MMNTQRFQTVGTAEEQSQQAAEDAGQAAGAAIRDVSEQIRTAAADVGAEVSRRADHVVEDLAKQVEAQPISALLIAGGVGLLAGLLLGRR